MTHGRGGGMAGLCGRRRAERWEISDAVRRAVAVVMIAATLVSIPAVGSEATDPPIADLDCEPSPAALEDIEFIAEQEGIDLDTAVARLGWQSCFSEAVAYLRTTYPETYAGAAVVDGGRSAWIAFTGEVPDEAVELAAQIPVAVQLIDDREVSEAELTETLRDIHEAVSRNQAVVAAAGSYDQETSTITIQAEPLDTLGETEREQLLATLQGLPVDNPAIDVEVLLVDDVGGSDAAAETSARSRMPTVALVALAMAAAVGLTFGLRRSRGRPRV